MQPLIAVRTVLLTVERWIGHVVMAAASLTLAAAVAIGFWQVFTRFVLQLPSTWSEPVAQMLIIWTVFLGIAGAIRAGALVSVDLAFRLSRGRAKLLLEAAIVAATLGLLGVMLWQGYQILWRVRFQTMAGVGISMAYAYAAIPVGAAFAILATLARWMDPDRHAEPADLDVQR